MIKILHIADVHLDSPFSGMSADEAQARRRDEQSSFTSAMTYARTSSVDIVLCAGDMFDSLLVTRDTVRLICDEFSRLSCPVFITPGNHDPATPGGIWHKIALPENVHVFLEPELKKYSCVELGVDVYGYGFSESDLKTNPLASAHVTDPQKINLICAHADMLSPLSAKAPLSDAILSAFGADYAALGHIHKFMSGEAGKCVWAYCGCTEGRSFDECGEKGAVAVDIEKENGVAKVSMHRLNFSKRHYETASVNVDGTETLSDVRSACQTALEAFDARSIVRLRLVGAVSPALVISPSAVEGLLSSAFPVKVVDETTPLWKSEFLEDDMSVRGEFYRMIKPKLNSADAYERNVALHALRYVLAALAGENISDI